MTTKFKRSGDQMHFTAAGTLVSGAIHVLGDTVGVLADNYVSGDEAVMGVTGTFGPVPCLSTDVITPGLDLYYDSGNARMTLVASTHKWAGKAANSSASGVATCDVTLYQAEA